MTKRLLRTFSLGTFSPALIFFVLSPAVYLFEYAFGYSGSIIRLYSLGAFSAFAVSEFGQWNRIIISPFLHYSIFHLLFDMFFAVVAAAVFYMRMPRRLFVSLFSVSAFFAFVSASFLYRAGLFRDGISMGCWPGIAGLLAFLSVDFIFARTARGGRTKVWTAVALILIVIPELIQYLAGFPVNHVVNLLGGLSGAMIHIIFYRRQVWRRRKGGKVLAIKKPDPRIASRSDPEIRKVSGL